MFKHFRRNKSGSSVKKLSNRNSNAVIIRPMCRIVGTIDSFDVIDFVGQMDGDLSGGTVNIHNGGTLCGTIVADTCRIHGVVSGTLNVNKLIISSTGSVSGEAHYNTLSIESGGIISGSCHPKGIASVTDISNLNPDEEKIAI